MASSVRGVASTYVLLQIFAISLLAAGEFPDFGVIQDIAADIQKKLRNYLDEATGFNVIQTLYEAESSKLDLQDVDGQELVEEMATNLGNLLAKKSEALKKSVEWAEKLALEYKWNGDLEIEDVPYVDCKNINISDPAYQYDELYHQIVSYENSSVHIPVEIYKGNIDILNDLAWTSHLDEQWRKNKEEDPELLWQYFGSQTGLMRNFPANVWEVDPEVPDLYDVRRRPWYTQGISSPKDMLILVDTSGSTQGIALTLMKQAIDSLLDTLSSNDFINVLHFAAEAYPVVPCFKSFVQANHWNKQILRDFVSGLVSKDMASYTAAFEYAFEEFRKLDELQNSTNGFGAMCNRVIMFLTDGGTEMPEEIFEKYNSNKSIRIFSYAVGPTANPVAAVRWIACQNKGFFYRIPAMGAIRSTVQTYISAFHSSGPESSLDIEYSEMYLDKFNYYKFLAYGLAESQTQDTYWTYLYTDSLAYETILSRQLALALDHDVGWTNLELDHRGLGVMTTVTMPVYNRTLDAGNQTILGVMGTDVTLSDMEKFTKTKKLGPNGYVMAINTNGYILIHPNLRAKKEWVSDPINIDFLDIEYSTPEKEELRRHMIDGESGQASITSYMFTYDEKHIDNTTRIYHYTAIPDTTFSLAVVTPTYAQLYFAGRTEDIPIEQGLRSIQIGESAVLLAPWTYCPHFELFENTTEFDDFIDFLLHNSSDCDQTLLQHLFTDGNVTQQMEVVWEKIFSEDNNGIFAFIIATNAGMTRVYPANASQIMDSYKDPWNTQYYRRSFDYSHWIYTAPYSDTAISTNSSMPLVLASRAVNIKVTNKIYIPAVIGAWVEQDRLRQIMFEREPACAQLDIYSCYFVDDGGFLILSNTEDDAYKVGLFFGDDEVEPVLMGKLVNVSVYLQNIHYDYQGVCPVLKKKESSASRLVPSIPPLLFDMMSLSWWTSKLTWSWINYEIMQWLFSSPEQYTAEGQVYEDYNVSCVKQQAQYTFSTGDKTEHKSDLICGNCTRTFATSHMKESNLLFVMVEKDCGGSCQSPVLLLDPVKVRDPNLKEAQAGICNIVQRYRRRPPCYDSNPNEDTSECSGGNAICWSLSTLILSLLAIFIWSTQELIN